MADWLQDEGTQVQWWKLLVCDPALSQPGQHEEEERAAGATTGKDWPKYRSVVVK